MIHSIIGRNVHTVLQDACWWMEVYGVKEPSRGGQVTTSKIPVMVEYVKPRERVLLWPERKANPFFHLFEAIWMLAGSNKLEYVARFNPRMAEFSDDGKVLHGAYGHRWHLQVPHIIDMLAKDPHTRRAVIGLWEPTIDLWSSGKDVPCNTHIYFRAVDGKLNMTVCNRSNDLIWGMCGSNVVHFSMLHEVIAWGAGLMMGSYYHFTNNLHIYDDVPKRTLYSRPAIKDAYSGKGAVEPYPMLHVHWETWLDECRRFVWDPTQSFTEPFFTHVCKPMLHAWEEQSIAPLKNCLAEDWREAGALYLNERLKATPG